MVQARAEQEGSLGDMGRTVRGREIWKGSGRMPSAGVEGPQGRGMQAGWGFCLAFPVIILSHRPQGREDIWSKSHEAKEHA